MIEYLENTFLITRIFKVKVMTSQEYSEKIALQVASLNKEEILRKIHTFRKFRLDFTDDYLENLPLDKLRHILLAAMITTAN
ncbi:MAG: hypothetical protein ABIG61_02790 [Planctomycetota bacterium]